jgi:hypothetical protein
MIENDWMILDQIVRIAPMAALLRKGTTRCTDTAITKPLCKIEEPY